MLIIKPWLQSSVYLSIHLSITCLSIHQSFIHPSIHPSVCLPTYPFCFVLGLYFKGFPGGSDGKRSACNAGDLGLILGLEDALEKGTPAPVFLRLPWWLKWYSPVFLPREAPGRKSLVGYSLWGCRV